MAPQQRDLALGHQSEWRNRFWACYRNCCSSCFSFDYQLCDECFASARAATAEPSRAQSVLQARRMPQQRGQRFQVAFLRYKAPFKISLKHPANAKDRPSRSPLAHLLLKPVHKSHRHTELAYRKIRMERNAWSGPRSAIPLRQTTFPTDRGNKNAAGAPVCSHFRSLAACLPPVE